MGKKKEDPIREAKEAIEKGRKKVAKHDWFDPENQETAELQLRLAEKAMSMTPPLPGPVKAHLKGIYSAITSDKRQREDHEEQLALKAAEDERDRLIATLATAGISTIPLGVGSSWLEWSEVQRGFLGRTKEVRRSCSATRYPLDSDEYRAEEPFYAMVEKLRGLGIKDEQMCLFQEKGAADPILAIRIREKPPDTYLNEPYIWVMRW